MQVTLAPLVEIGDTISYCLRASDRPIHPLRVWHGIVERRAERLFWVISIDQGYAGMIETVMPEQITDVQKKNPGKATIPLHQDLRTMEDSKDQ